MDERKTSEEIVVSPLIKDKRIDINEQMWYINENNIDTKLLPLWKNEDSHTLKTIYECEYLNNKSKKKIIGKLSVSNVDHSISVITKDDLLMFEINQKDFISFVDESDIPKKDVDKIYTNWKLGQDELLKKALVRIMYIPKNEKSKSNCCKCFFGCECRSCTMKYWERDIVMLYFLINKHDVSSITKFIALNTYAKLNELEAVNRKRRLLIFVNPVSGKGISLKLWEKAKAIWDWAYLDMTLIFTERYKHAYDTVLNADMNNYDGVVNCSGDGIWHEIVNAIFHREDKDAILNRIGIGILPAGSGNGFTRALTDYSGEDNRIETNAYFIAKGLIKKVDVQEWELRDVP
ncbi:MAG: diacylglycerol kinase family protein, partial [Mycoplasma sp.]